MGCKDKSLSAPVDETDNINLLLALPPDGFLAGSSGINVRWGIVYLRLTQGPKATGLG